MSTPEKFKTLPTEIQDLDFNLDLLHKSGLLQSCTIDALNDAWKQIKMDFAAMGDMGPDEIRTLLCDKLFGDVSLGELWSAIADTHYQDGNVIWGELVAAGEAVGEKLKAAVDEVKKMTEGVGELYDKISNALDSSSGATIDDMTKKVKSQFKKSFDIAEAKLKAVWADLQKRFVKWIDGALAKVLDIIGSISAAALCKGELDPKEFADHLMDSMKKDFFTAMMNCSMAENLMAMGIPHSVIAAIDPGDPTQIDGVLQCNGYNPNEFKDTYGMYESSAFVEAAAQTLGEKVIGIPASNELNKIATAVVNLAQQMDPLEWFNQDLGALSLSKMGQLISQARKDVRDAGAKTGEAKCDPTTSDPYPGCDSDLPEWRNEKNMSTIGRTFCSTFTATKETLAKG